MRKIQVITNSERECFGQCRAKHGYAYHELLRPLVTAKPLTRGTLFHAGVSQGWREAWSLENWHLPLVERAELAKLAAMKAVNLAVDSGHTQIADDAQERHDELEELARIATWCAKYYFQVRQYDLDPGRMIPLAIEQPFSIRLRNAKGNLSNVQLDGVIDLVLYDREDNMIRVEDFKLTELGPDAMSKKLDLNTQVIGYLLAVREFLRGHAEFFNFLWKLCGSAAVPSNFDLATCRTGVTAFNVMKAKIPTVPSINQKGDVSVKQIDTIPEIYNEALTEQLGRGIPVSDKQRELLAKLSARSGWFQQLEFSRSNEEIRRFIAELEVEAKSIRETGRRPELRIRNPGHCTAPASYGCAYKAVCMDPTSQTIRNNFYRVATSAHEEVKEAGQNGEQQEEVDKLNW